ncbi:hypothetical protein BaRGS_00012908 [Batillaria attramentaria]|uniref:Uncharacterized protein n=1 Tax=Batillaria attramentaria TaxID=370345 RepID=A0ABD0L9H3_9CAEN
MYYPSLNPTLAKQHSKQTNKQRNQTRNHPMNRKHNTPAQLPSRIQRHFIKDSTSEGVEKFPNHTFTYKHAYKYETLQYTFSNKLQTSPAILLTDIFRTACLVTV